MSAITTFQRTRYFSRYRKIIGVLVKYGFEDVVAHSAFASMKWKKWIPERDGVKVIEYTRYERIRMACEELGPTFIKFAQILSNRPDALPEPLIHELEKLQDHVPSFPVEQVKEKIEREIGGTVEDLFLRFDDVPIASASMAQVHRAKLRTGEEVVLKVQRPNIRKNIIADIEIMKDLANILEKNFPEVAVMEPMSLVKTFEKAIRDEMNFWTEARNLRRFKRNFKDREGIKIPEVYNDFSSEKVLCMEFAPGVKISDTKKLREMGVDTKHLAKRGMDLYYEQVFDYGFFHADPHPGNIFVTTDEHLIVFLDFGMMGTLRPRDQDFLSDLMYYLYRRDVKNLARSIKQLSSESLVERWEDFEYEVAEFVDEADVTSIEEVNMSEVIDGLFEVMYKYKIRLPRNLHLLLRALVIVEGVGLRLDPGYNVMDNIQPYAEKLIAARYSPGRLWGQFVDGSLDAVRMVKDLPGDMRIIIEKLKKGRLHIQFEHMGLEPIINTLNRVSNRIAFAIIVAAGMLGSALIVLSDIPPHFRGVPVFGILGFLISSFLALGPLISMIRKGRF